MSRLLLTGLSLVITTLVTAATADALAETCSSSTLASPDFSVARWCGDPPGAGTLRLVRRGGRAEEFVDVPLDSYREVVRTPRVAQYVAEEVAPRFERGMVAEAAPAPGLPRGSAARRDEEAEGPAARPIALRPGATRSGAGEQAGGARGRARGPKHRRASTGQAAGRQHPR